MLGVLEELSNEAAVLFPIHPRTRKMIAEFGLQAWVDSHPKIRLVDPLGYLDFLSLMERAKLVITDSGGIQEETTYLGVPCITLRSNTERPITVEVGTNELFGNDLAAAKRRGKEILRGRVKSGAVPDQWDGRAAERIASIIVSALYSTSERMP